VPPPEFAQIYLEIVDDARLDRIHQRDILFVRQLQRHLDLEKVWMLAFAGQIDQQIAERVEDGLAVLILGRLVLVAAASAFVGSLFRPVHEIKRRTPAAGAEHDERCRCDDDELLFSELFLAAAFGRSFAFATFGFFAFFFFFVFLFGVFFGHGGTPSNNLTALTDSPGIRVLRRKRGT